MLVADPWQRRGLGKELLRRLVEVAREERISRLRASILPENHEMLRMCEAMGFRLRRALDSPLVEAELGLGASERQAA